MHVVSDKDWTLLGVHAKRGSKGMDELGFIPAYIGSVVLDCLPSYFKEYYVFEHVLCNAHLLRECQGIVEHDGLSN
jgi:transposase